jgi:acetyltransferase
MLLGERAAHERLSRICHGDYDREITLVGERIDPASGVNHILGVGRLTKMHGLNAARFSVLVSDACQGLGVGKELVRQLIVVSKEEQLSHIETLITADNQVMRHICQELGFRFMPTSEEQILRVEIEV